jgi:protein-S-isoprenylcysteine O-methyltransferase Ste14
VEIRKGVFEELDGRAGSRLAVSPFTVGVPLLIVSHVFAILSLVSWLVFLSRGAFDIINLGFGTPGALFWDSLLSLAFFAQHSIMVRGFFKRWLARAVSPDYHGAVYAAASGIVLLGLTLFWQAPPHGGIVLHGLPSPFVPILSVLNAACFIWGVKALGSFDMFGSAPILRSLRNEPAPDPGPLTIRGPYRWVRHPLYFCCLVAIWNSPGFTADRLLYNVMWTCWIVAGTMLEERDLTKAFGAVYRDYRKKVPMLVPWRVRPVSPTPTTKNSARNGR